MYQFNYNVITCTGVNYWYDKKNCWNKFLEILVVLALKVKLTEDSDI